MSEYEFRLLRDHIHDHCGLYYDDGKMGLFESRIRFRLRLLDIGSFSDYYNYLRYNPRSGEEMDGLIPHLTNNETYFFREMNQLSVFVTDVMERITKAKASRGDRTVSVVSCGCSSGEEAYSIAILLGEAGYYARGLDIRITGMDIDRKVLEKAAAGLFTGYSLRAADRARIGRYFEKRDDRYELDARVRERVRFVRSNIMEKSALDAMRGADAIFCRNMLIYFSDRSMRAAAEIFYDALAPHGFLFLGHSESLTRVTDAFVPMRCPGAIVYRKKGGGPC